MRVYIKDSSTLLDFISRDGLTGLMLSIEVVEMIRVIFLNA